MSEGRHPNAIIAVQETNQARQGARISIMWQSVQRSGIPEFDDKISPELRRTSVRDSPESR